MDDTKRGRRRNADVGELEVIHEPRAGAPAVDDAKAAVAAPYPVVADQDDRRPLVHGADRAGDREVLVGAAGEVEDDNIDVVAMPQIAETVEVEDEVFSSFAALLELAPQRGVRAEHGNGE